jgi:hypothetical protein
VAQEAWIGVLRGLPRFRGQAKSGGARDRRARALPAIVAEETGGADPAVDPQRFLDASHPREPRHWAVPPAPWARYLQGALAAAARRRFEAHLAECPGCERYLDQIRETRRLVGRLSPEDISPEARETLRAAFREWRRVARG